MTACAALGRGMLFTLQGFFCTELPIICICKGRTVLWVRRASEATPPVLRDPCALPDS